jgi:hypothetical protein
LYLHTSSAPYPQLVCEPGPKLFVHFRLVPLMSVVAAVVSSLSIAASPVPPPAALTSPPPPPSRHSIVPPPFSFQGHRSHSLASHSPPDPSPIPEPPPLRLSDHGEHEESQASDCREHVAAFYDSACAPGHPSHRSSTSPCASARPDVRASWRRSKRHCTLRSYPTVFLVVSLGRV